MNTQAIAKRLAELCRQGQFEAAQKELFSQDAVSKEPYATPDFAQETKGLQAILEKGKKWDAMVESVNGMDVSEPLIAGNSFACAMHMDVNIKGRGRMDMTELCVYTVKDGKIVSEQFFM